MEEAEVLDETREKIERLAARRAGERARNARWDLNVAIFLFAVLILVIILITYTKIGIEIVAPVAIFGLAMVWLVLKRTIKGTVEETIEEKVQKALRERWK